MKESGNTNLLTGLRVVELAGVLAGPSVGYFFAELGATVIKVENPNTNGDVTRSWKLPSEDPRDPASAYFWSVNAFKEFISLDISTEPQLKKLYALIKDADIVICNYKKGDAEKLKVDYFTLSKLQPKLIYASINGFGTESPRTAYDLILQAESGFMYMNGEPKSNPVKMPVALIDLMAGHQLKEAVLLALINRYKNDSGSHVTVSLFDSAVASLANQATNWLIGEHLPEASGSRHPNIAPYGEIFETNDKQLVTFAIGSNKQFAQLCELINYPSLANDPKYLTNQSRVLNREELYHILNGYIQKCSFNDLYTACHEREIPIAKIRNLREVFELPEAKAMLKKFIVADKEISVVSGIAFKFHNNV